MASTYSRDPFARGVIVTCTVLLALLATTLEGCGGSSNSGPPAGPSATIKLANGVDMPLLSAGTWLYNDSVAALAVEAALKAGFKHIDTAYDYGNQVGVGKGLFASGVNRSDVFITTKVPGCGMDGLGKEACYNNTLKLVKQDIKELGSGGFNIQYLDLILIHFPPCMAANGTEKGPFDTVCAKKGTSCSDPSNCKAIREQWRAVEYVYAHKLVRAVGVSNYCSACFKCLSNSTVMPMVNQVQMHVGMGPDPQGFLSFAQHNNIALQAWSPLGSGGHGSTKILAGNLTGSIGKAHNKSTAQVALKWLLKHGVAVVTKSNNPKHLAENVALFDWDLTRSDMDLLDSADFAKADTPSFMCKDVPPTLSESESNLFF